MIKALFALTVLLASTQAHASQDVAVVVETLTPLENAFEVSVKGGTVYHLENAARMSMSKMNALNNSLDNSTAVKIRVEGKEILDIVLN